MHQTILTQRRAAAAARITEQGRALVKKLKLEPALADRLQPVGVKELAVAEMMRLEAIADLLDRLAKNAGVKVEPVTAVTVNEFIVPPAAEQEPAAEGEEQQAGEADGPGMERKTGDEYETVAAAAEGLPAPTDEEEPAKKSTRGARSTTRARKSKKG